MHRFHWLRHSGEYIPLQTQVERGRLSNLSKKMKWVLGRKWIHLNIFQNERWVISSLKTHSIPGLVLITNKSMKKYSERRFIVLWSDLFGLGVSKITGRRVEINFNGFTRFFTISFYVRSWRKPKLFRSKQNSKLDSGRVSFTHWKIFLKKYFP